MKLFYTPNSPYSRVTRVVALALKVPVDFVEVTVRESAEELLNYNPAAKVPSLELDDGIVLSETRLICEHFESRSTHPILSTVDDHEGRHWEGIIGGFMDGIAVWVREARRPIGEQSPSVLVLEEDRCKRCLAYFETNWHCKFDMKLAPIMLLSAIELMDKRLSIVWKLEHPRLSAWYDTFATTPLLEQTAPLQ